MILKREIRTNYCIDAQMLDTSEDGIVLTIEKNLVKGNTLELITAFVNQHALNLLLENGRYHISTNALTPSR